MDAAEEQWGHLRGGTAKPVGRGIRPWARSASRTYARASAAYLSRSSGSPGCGSTWSTPRPVITSPHKNRVSSPSPTSPTLPGHRQHLSTEDLPSSPAHCPQRAGQPDMRATARAAPGIPQPLRRRQCAPGSGRVVAQVPPQGTCCPGPTQDATYGHIAARPGAAAMPPGITSSWKRVRCPSKWFP